jgi:hypothetical protein
MGRLACSGALIAALGLGAVACGGSASGASGGPSSSPTASAPVSSAAGGAGTASRIYQYLNGVSAKKKNSFVQCMRSNGESSFPSTLTIGALRSAGITLRSSTFRSAFASCRSTLAK